MSAFRWWPFVADELRIIDTRDYGRWPSLSKFPRSEEGRRISNLTNAAKKARRKKAKAGRAAAHMGRKP